MKPYRYALIATVAVILGMVACSEQEAPVSTISVEPTVSETEIDLATRAGAPLFEGMGTAEIRLDPLHRVFRYLVEALLLWSEIVLQVLGRQLQADWFGQEEE